MTLNEIKEILKDGAIGYFATANGEQLEVRGWQYQFAEGNKFYFATANTKDVYQQMKANPQVAFACESNGYNIRLSGKANFVTDPAKKEELFSKLSEGVQGMYKSGSNPIVELFYIESGEFKVAQGYAPFEVIKF
jgi:uncharacterized pyridoxamine 5'-phosphate oxidase family protein